MHDYSIYTHINRILMDKETAIGALGSLVIAIFLGHILVKNTLHFLQSKAKDIFESSKVKENYGFLQDKWNYWVTNAGIDKYNAWLGWCEIILFYFCLLFKKPEGIGAWLAFKVAAKWASWTNIIRFPERINGIDDFSYLKLRNDLATTVLQKFLIGTILNILVAVVGIIIFSMVRVRIISTLDVLAIIIFLIAIRSLIKLLNRD